MIQLFGFFTGKGSPPEPVPVGDPVALLPAPPGLEGLPAGPQERAYAIACEVLRTDPALRMVGAAQRLVTFTASDVGRLVPGAPGFVGIEGFLELADSSALPLIRIYPEDAPADWRQENAHDAGFPIRIELAVNGQRADAIMRLWYAVVRAFWPLRDGSAKSEARRKALDDICDRHSDPLHGRLPIDAFQIEQHATGVLISSRKAGNYSFGAGSIRVNMMEET